MNLLQRKAWKSWISVLIFPPSSEGRLLSVTSLVDHREERIHVHPPQSCETPFEKERETSFHSGCDIQKLTMQRCIGWQRTMTWWNLAWRNGTKQCSLFRDTITTDCPLSVDFIPCCFCYTSLLNFLHINILLLVYLWCMKIFWLTDGMLHVNGIFFLIKRFAKEMENRKRDIQILFPFQLHMK